MTGRDLFTNHILFFLYNHQTIFPENKRPRGIKGNGFLLLDGEKMSKSTGNFMTLKEALEQYSADGMRLALADGGDTFNDGNFVRNLADSSIKRLFTICEFAKEFLDEYENHPENSGNEFFDKHFQNQINYAIMKTEESFNNMEFKAGLVTGFFDLQSACDSYMNNCKNKPTRSLVRRYLDVLTVLLSPIAPHTCEYLYHLLGHKGSVVNAKWPVATEIDLMVQRQGFYLEKVLHKFRKKFEYVPKNEKGKERESATVVVQKEFPAWHKATLALLRANIDPETKALPDKKQFTQLAKNDNAVKKAMKFAMAIMAQVQEDYNSLGMAALEDSLGFDEMDFLDKMRPAVESAFKGLPFVILDAVKDKEKCPGKSADTAKPGTPAVAFHVKK